MPAEQLTRQVPAAALQFRGGFAVGQLATPGDAGPAKPRTCTITALSGEPVESWYWGRCLHDLAGMQVAKPALPLDYCHDDGDVVGFCDKFDVASGKLVASGQLTPFERDDRASEIAFKADAGVPWEASIFFDPRSMKIEVLDCGQLATVNGKQVEGPLTIFRQWSLRGIAICPYGMDAFTSSQFRDSQDQFTIPVTRSTAMAEQATPPVAPVAPVVPATPAPTPAVSPVAASPAEEAAKPQAAIASATGAQSVTPPAAQPTAEQLRAVEGKKFTDAFGDRGGLWYAQGLSFDAAQAKFTAELKAENEGLKQRLGAAALAGAVPAAGGALSFGEAAPVSAEPAQADQAATKLASAQQKYGKGFGAFAAGITFKK
jgi:hypothetical protein